jgi:hypothetical protein
MMFWGGVGGLAVLSVFMPHHPAIRRRAMVEEEDDYYQTYAAAAPVLYDNFQSGSLYTLKDGQKSPNGKWFCDYAGFGSVKTIVTSTATNQRALQQMPMASTQTGETHASLVTSTTVKYTNVELRVKMRTRKQLRRNSPPNAWECAWLMWKYVDMWHHYYFILKPNGIEIGKKDNDRQAEEQVFLYTADNPKLVIDRWENIKISQVDNRIRVWRGSTLIADAVDRTMSQTLGNSPGSIGLYNEDAHVQFDDIHITPL